VLIIGASGGIGTAFLQLGEIVGIKMYALASESKHAILRKYSAIPIDYKTQDYHQIICTFEPDGIDAVFDGVGGDYIRNSFTLLRRGGSLVTYANPLSLRRTFIQLGQVLYLNFLPNGRSASYYSTGQSRINRRPFLQDWAELFKLLQDGQIEPIIAKTYSIDQAAEANEILEAGNVIGNIVLTGPGLR
jgi:NADPH:quinone reductase-like Zn-dependent oxidoreductase